MYLDLLEEVQHLGDVPCSTFPDAFFPEDLGTGETQGRRMARQLCQSCPLRLQCLEYALEAKEDFGIWGGLTSNERKDMRRDRRAKMARKKG